MNEIKRNTREKWSDCSSNMTSGIFKIIESVLSHITNMKTEILVIMICIYSMGSLYAKTDKQLQGRVPFQFYGHSILVKARIDDSQEDYNFIIDTGGVAAIDKAVAQDLGLKQRGPMAKITTLDFNGFKIENVFCFTTFDFEILGKLGSIHGMIGSNLMERFKVTFDFKSRTVHFSTDTAFVVVPENGLRFHFRNHPVNNAPLIKFTVNQQIIEGMVDTGQPYPVVLPLEDFETYRKSEENVWILSKGLMIKWPETDPHHNILTRLKSCEFDGLKIKDLICIFGEPPPVFSMPLIGTDLLSQFKIVIDYPKDEMTWIPYPDRHFPGNVFSLGIGVDLSENDEVFVEGVWEDSPADKAGIKVGDRIIAFNSREASADRLSELMMMMEDDGIKSMVFKIKNQYGKRRVRLKKSELF